TLIQALETHQEIKEIEMLAEDKLHNELEANTQSKKTIEVEMEISKENSQTDQISDKTKIKSIDISADLLEIKPESEILEEKFERLDKEIKLRPGNNALEGSIWAPKIGNCRKKENLITRVLAANVTGKNNYQRGKTLRWLLKRNTHIKEISEKFIKGNLWCIITFDCEKGYKEARTELENKKEEHERLQLLIEKKEEKKQYHIRKNEKKEG